MHLIILLLLIIILLLLLRKVTLAPFLPYKQFKKLYWLYLRIRHLKIKRGIRVMDDDVKFNILVYVLPLLAY